MSKKWCYVLRFNAYRPNRSSLIETLEKSSSQTDAVAYIYFEQDLIDLDSAPANLLAAIIKQLLKRQTCVSPEMHESYDAIKDQEHIGRYDFKNLLKDECSGFQRVFIILDALDRGDENVVNMFLKDLREISDGTGNVKVLASSLDMLGFGIMLGDPKPKAFQPAQDDIERFIKKQIEDSAQMERYVRRLPSLRQTIITVISEKAHGL